MSDMHNWRISVEQCHAKHIGPPPPLLRRINYDQAHRAPTQTGGSVWSAFRKALVSVWRRIRGATPNDD